MDTVIGSGVAVAAGLGVRGVAVLGLYVRLRWRVRQEHAHRQYVETLARTLPAGSKLEETGTNGSTLRLTVGPAENEPERQAQR